MAEVAGWSSGYRNDRRGSNSSSSGNSPKDCGEEDSFFHGDQNNDKAEISRF